jgi:hypothetical protein
MKDTRAGPWGGESRPPHERTSRAGEVARDRRKALSRLRAATRFPTETVPKHSLPEVLCSPAALRPYPDGSGCRPVALRPTLSRGLPLSDF